ncbi:YhgE/Pip domain-containing protein [Cytobacillus purgationiresistens]|uniref:Membrane protein n=1 Tax=Cytobacillus purgationiresistens TaxID=863449 RepID=A0ABU0AN63_9BACI|nr:YhgE/Pip domain-containing protein [Cytobacillus purgationiresistens]MDQ0272618.1 putative membrane protein [Cytobacillus purgationiresistens]
MRQIINIVKQDFRNLKRVPLVALLLIGLAFLPSLYAWFNIAATWDPYSETGQIKVAVVNEDAGTDIDGKQVNIGNELVDNLKDNDQMGWTFVNREEAEQGVRDGDYYASVYIDHAFSEQLTSVISGDPEAPEVRYEVNEKLNAIAPKMTSAGASAIVAEISESFLAEASEALFTGFNNIGLKLEEELPTIRKVENNIFELEKRFPEINELGDKIVGLNQDWPEIKETVNKVIELEQHFPELNNGAEQILALEDKLPQVNNLGSKVLELEEMIPEIQKAADGLSTASEQFGDISGQLTSALEGVHKAQAIIVRVQEALPAANKIASDAEEYVNHLNQFLSENEGAINPIIDVIIQNAVMIQHGAESIDTILQQIENDQVNESVKKSIAALQKQLESNIQLLEESIAMFSNLNESLPNGELNPIINQLTTLQKEMGTLNNALSNIGSGDLSSDQIAAIRQQAQEVSRQAASVNTYLNGGGRESINRAMADLQETAQKAGNDLAALQSELPNIEEVLINAESIANIGQEQLETIIQDLPAIEARVNELVEKVQADLPIAIQAIHQVSQFIQEDWPGIEEKIHEVANFIRNDLPGIETEFSRIAGLVSENLPEVEKGLSEVSDFIGTSLPGLEDTVEQTADRIRAFEQDNDLGELISLLKNDINKESAFFAEPVKLVEEQLYPIPNYGSANTPFYTALCLWVGALLLANLLKTDVHPEDMREDYKVHHVYLGRLVLFLVVGFLQGLIVSLGDLFILGAYAANPVWFVIFTIAIALIFMTMVYTIVSVFGNIGKAIAIILMVLQLSGAGGTFPIQVAPPFFQAINPFLPFTHAINILREAVGGIVPGVVWKSFFYLFLFFLAALGLGLGLKKPLTPWLRKTANKSRSSRMVD